MATIKEIKVLMQLEQQKFMQDMKNVDKAIKDLNKDITDSNKQARDLSKEFAALNKELTALKNNAGAKSLNADILKAVNSFKDLNKQLKASTKEMTDLKKVSADVAKNFKDISKTSMTDVNRLASTINSIKNTKIIDNAALSQAVQMTREISKNLSSAGVDVSGLNGRIGNIDVNANNLQSATTRVNVSAGSSGLNTAANMTQVGILAYMAKPMSELAKAFKDFDTKGLTDAIRDLKQAIDSNSNSLFNNTMSNNLSDDLKRLQIETDIARIVDERVRDEERLQKNLEQSAKRRKELEEQITREIKDRASASNRRPSHGEPDGTGDDRYDSETMGFSGGSGGGLPGGLGAGAFTEGLAASSPLVGRLVASLGRLGPVGLVAAAAIAAIVAALTPMVKGMMKAVQATSEFEDAISKFDAVTLDSVGTAKEFGDTLTEAFGSQGYTQDVAAFADSLTYVYRNLKLTGDAAEDMNNRIQAVAKVTGYDTKEVIRAQSQLMTNLGMDAERALDMIAGAYRQTGDMSDDLLDSLAEYSSQIRDSGLSAEYFYTAIAKGAESGAFQIDKIGDVLKEVNLRLNDPTDQKFIKGLNKLGLSYEKINAGFKKGGKDADEAMNAIMQGIDKLGSEAEKKNVINAMFGSPGEDIGNQFFQMMADADKTVQDFTGSVNEAQDAIENTWSYQVTQLRNSFKALWEEAGEQVLPYLTELAKGFNGEIDGIKKAVSDNLAPAFQNLAIAIADALGLNRPNDFADMIVEIINLVAKSINFMAGVVVVLGKIGMAIGIIWNAIQIVFKGFDTFVDAAADGLIYIFEGVMRTIGNVIRGGVNLAIDGINILINKINSMGKISIMGKTIIDTPNIPTIQKWGGAIDWGSAWTNTWSSNNFKTNWSANTSSIMGDVDDIVSLSKGLFNNPWNDEQVKRAQKKASTGSNGTGAAGRQSTNTFKPSTATDGAYSGYNPTDDDKKDADDAAKKAAEEAHKKLLDALKTSADAASDAVKKLYDDIKNMYDLAKKLQEDNIAFDLGLAEQDWANKPRMEALQAEYDFYDKLKDKYILTADQMLEYQKHMQDLSRQMEEESLTKFKAKLDEEVRAEQEKNNKTIQDNQRVVDALDDQLDQLNKTWDVDDKKNSIAETQKELAKYAAATSTAGIAKRKELEKQLAEQQKELERTNQANKIEEQKKGLEDANAVLEQANEDIATKYEKLYDDIVKKVENGEDVVKTVQELALKETNASVKTALDELATSYENAFDRMTKAVVSNVDLQNARIMDAKRAWQEAASIDDQAGMDAAHAEAEDARSKGGTIGADQDVDKVYGDKNGQRINPDYAEFKANGAEWMQLQYEIENSGDPNGTLKARQKALNTRNNALRKKYNITDMEADIPQYLKYHGGGVVNGSVDNLGEVPAKLLNGEVVFTKQQFGKLMNLLNVFTPSLGLSSNLTGTPVGAMTINNNVNVTGDNHFHNNADLEEFTQKLGSMTQNRQRTTGIRSV